MSKKLSKILSTAGAFLLLGGLVACGGGNSGGGEGGGGGGGGGGGTTTTVEINFWHTFGQTIIDNLTPQLNKFKALVKKNENVDVTINLVPNSNYPTINENIKNGLNTGNIPTIAVAYPDHVADYLEAEGDTPGKFMVNLDDYFTNEDYGFGNDAYLGDPQNDSLDDFISAYVDGGRHYTREGTYSFPYMKSTEAMLYNYDAIVKVLKHYKPEFNGSKSLIQQYMGSLDWEEFMNLCREVKKYKNEINPDLVTPAFYDSDGNLFISQLYQAKIGYSSIVKNDQGKSVGHIDFATGENRTNAEDLVTGLREDYAEKLFETKGTFATYGSDSFKNVESVFTIGSTGGSGYSFTNDFEIGVCKVPSVDSDNPVYVTQGPDLCIFKNPALSDAANKTRAIYAWRLIKYLTNAENSCKICLESEGYLPARKSAYQEDLYLDFIESDETQAHIATLVTDVIKGRYFNTACFPGSAQLRTEAGGIVTEALTKSTSITSIFDTAINNATMYIK